jgi:hypothetical protein
MPGDLRGYSIADVPTGWIHNYYKFFGNGIHNDSLL